MTKEQQDLSWAFLPKEAREEIKRKYKIAENDIDLFIQTLVLDDIFGHHNLTSNTEPEEMLMVKRKDVIDFYNKYIGNPTREISRLGLRKEIKSLFGDSLEGLPDKKGIDCDKLNKMLDEALEKETPESLNEWLDSREQTSVQVEPKFKVGDKVYQTTGHDRLEEYTVKKVYTDKSRGVVYDIQGLITIIGVEENNLCLSCQNPYTKLEAKDKEECPYTDGRTCNFCMGKGWCNYKPKDNMEDKELNLCELLKGSDNEIFYNPLLGNVTVTPSSDGKLLHIHQDGFTVDISSDGKDSDGNMALFPSKEQRDWKMWEKPKKYSAIVRVKKLSSSGKTLDALELLFPEVSDFEVKEVLEKIKKYL